MFKPKKPVKPPEEPLGPSRLRLPTEIGMRTFAGIKELMADAKEKVGCLIELPWTTSKPSQRYILTVQWDKGSTQPLWSLYEENEVEQRIVWSQPWNPADVQLMYDVLAMGTGAETTVHTTFPDALKRSQPESEETEQKPASAAPAQTPAKAPEAPAPTPAPPAAAPALPTAGQPPAGFPDMPYAAPMPPGYPPMPGVPQPFPPYPQGMPGQPYPPAPPYPTAQPYPMPGSPMGYPPPQAPPPGMGAPNYPMPPMPNPNLGWQYGGGNSAPPTNAPGLMPSINPGLEPAAPMHIDMELLEKRPNILLGTLLINADLITEPTLEAALKIQDLVRAQKLDAEKAPEILKQLFSMGASIEDYINPSDMMGNRKAAKGGQPQTKSEHKVDAQTKRAPLPPVDKEDLQIACELLVKAGLLTQNDITSANRALSQYSGDIREALLAGGKLDINTLDAALISASLVRVSSMKSEQCIIALNYCSRSRVGFDEALEEMNWENPRKSRPAR